MDDLVTVLYSRNRHNTINPLYSKKKNKIKYMKIQEKKNMLTGVLQEKIYAAPVLGFHNAHSYSRVSEKVCNLKSCVT